MSLSIAITINGLPDEQLSRAAKVEVHERLGEPTQYLLTYLLDVGEGDFGLLREPRLGPNSELSVLAMMESGVECLVKGPVHGQQIRLVHGGAGSQLEVRGSDALVKMDREFKSNVWANVSDNEAVLSIVAQYGLLPDVGRTNARHLELKHSLIQRGSDLQFVRKLARRNGFHFWTTCNPLGIETAHFKRLQLGGEAAVDLVINEDARNLDSLDIHWDVERPTSVEGTQHDLNNHGPLNGAVAQSPQSPLGAQDLRSITGDVRSTSVAAPANDAGDMQVRGEATLMEAEWFIRANCKTSFHQLGKLVRAHTLANVQGAGSRHSGKYLVSGVRHLIDPSSHSMEIELLRNGWDE